MIEREEEERGGEETWKRGKDEKEERHRVNAFSPTFSGYPISCSAIRAAARKLLNYCRLTGRFFRVALISRRKGGLREGCFCRLSQLWLWPGAAHWFLPNRGSLNSTCHFITGPPSLVITSRSTAKCNQLADSPPISTTNFHKTNATKYMHAHYVTRISVSTITNCCKYTRTRYFLYNRKLLCFS